MGLLVDGRWQDRWYESKNGRFQRESSRFRHQVTASGKGGFPAQAGRYHLYVSLACPWAHRTLIMRRLKGLESMITVSVVNWLMPQGGWNFAPGPGVVPDSVNGAQSLRQLYLLADPHYDGRWTVPVLWDKQRNTIVNNE